MDHIKRGDNEFTMYRLFYYDHFVAFVQFSSVKQEKRTRVFKCMTVIYFVLPASTFLELLIIIFLFSLVEAKVAFALAS